MSEELAISFSEATTTFLHVGGAFGAGLSAMVTNFPRGLATETERWQAVANALHEQFSVSVARMRDMELRAQTTPSLGDAAAFRGWADYHAQTANTFLDRSMDAKAQIEASLSSYAGLTTRSAQLDALDGLLHAWADTSAITTLVDDARAAAVPDAQNQAKRYRVGFGHGKRPRHQRRHHLRVKLDSCLAIARRALALLAARHAGSFQSPWYASHTNCRIGS